MNTPSSGRLYPEVDEVGGVRYKSVNDDTVDDENTLLIRTSNSDIVTIEKPHYEIFFVVMPLFCGYACLFALQRQVKSIAYEITEADAHLSRVFAGAASLVYAGNLVFRLGHNFIFWFAQPRTRVLISMGSMAISMLLITLIFLAFHRPPSLAWVFLAYAFGGIGIGTFESNVLSSIAPLGKTTKLWAIIAIPTGILSITVGGFILLEYKCPPGYIYLGVLCYIIVGMAIYIVRFYTLPHLHDNAVTLRQFLHELKEWRCWAPQIKWHSFALLVDMFCVSMFSPGVMLYIYTDEVEFPWFHRTLSADWLFVIYDAAFFLGDTLSRRIFYNTRIIFPVFFWVFAAGGIGCALSNASFFVPFCGFLVAFCNGSIYAQANRKIDATVDPKFSLIAFSFWLFIGDMGSVLGSNLIPYVRDDIKNLYKHH